MATIKWAKTTNSGRGPNADGDITIMSTALNALAASTGAVLSPAIVNDPEFDLLGDFELAVTYAVAPTAGGLVKLYVVRTVDGTNYEDGSTAVIFPQNGYVGAFVVRNVGTLQRMVLPEVSIPPDDFKILLVNEANQAFTASGHTLKARLYKYQSVG